MSLAEFFLLAVAGFAAGIANAVAGGGTFFTFAVMVYFGMATLDANATSAVALVPASLASVLAYRDETITHWRETWPFVVIAIVGGIAGALLLLWIGDEGFRPLVPWLLAGATLLFAFSTPIRKAVSRVAKEGSTTAFVSAYILMSIVAVYGGFFGAGMGVMMLAALAIIAAGDFHKANMIKNIVALFAQAVAVVLFIAGGLVHWPHAIVMIASSIVTGYFGVTVARKVPEPVMRGVVVVIGAILSVIFFLR